MDAELDQMPHIGPNGFARNPSTPSMSFFPHHVTVSNMSIFAYKLLARGPSEDEFEGAAQEVIQHHIHFDPAPGVDAILRITFQQKQGATQSEIKDAVEKEMLKWLAPKLSQFLDGPDKIQILLKSLSACFKDPEAFRQSIRDVFKDSEEEAVQEPAIKQEIEEDTDAQIQLQIVSHGFEDTDIPEQQLPSTREAPSELEPPMLSILLNTGIVAAREEPKVQDTAPTRSIATVLTKETTPQPANAGLSTTVPEPAKEMVPPLVSPLIPTSPKIPIATMILPTQEHQPIHSSREELHSLPPKPTSRKGPSNANLSRKPNHIGMPALSHPSPSKEVANISPNGANLPIMTSRDPRRRPLAQPPPTEAPVPDEAPGSKDPRRRSLAQAPLTTPPTPKQKIGEPKHKSVTAAVTSKSNNAEMEVNTMTPPETDGDNKSVGTGGSVSRETSPLFCSDRSPKAIRTLPANGLPPTPIAVVPPSPIVSNLPKKRLPDRALGNIEPKRRKSEYSSESIPQRRERKITPPTRDTGRGDHWSPTPVHRAPTPNAPRTFSSRPPPTGPRVHSYEIPLPIGPRWEMPDTKPNTDDRSLFSRVSKGCPETCLCQRRRLDGTYEHIPQARQAAFSRLEEPVLELLIGRNGPLTYASSADWFRKAMEEFQNRAAAMPCHNLVTFVLKKNPKGKDQQFDITLEPNCEMERHSTLLFNPHTLRAKAQQVKGIESILERFVVPNRALFPELDKCELTRKLRGFWGGPVSNVRDERR